METRRRRRPDSGDPASEAARARQRLGFTGSGTLLGAAAEVGRRDGT